MSLFFKLLFVPVAVYFAVGVAFIGPAGLLIVVLYNLGFIPIEFAGNSILLIFLISIFPWLWFSWKFGKEVYAEHFDDLKQRRKEQLSNFSRTYPMDIYEIRNELERLKQRNLFGARDWLFFVAGGATVFFIWLASTGYFQYGWPSLFVVILLAAAIHGFYLWYQSISAEAYGDFASLSLKLDEHISDVEQRKYAEGYRDGVSAANDNCIDPALM